MIDLLGMGRSSRPEWTADNLEDSENFFVDSLELFRLAMEFDTVVIAGHSFGGYVSSCYAMKYP